MGVFPRRNAILTSELFTPLAEYLSENLHRPVKLVTTKDFPSFWEGVQSKRYDIVHYNQYHYVESTDNYQVIACNEEQGHETISGALYVRTDSGITSISQLKGRKIIFGGGRDAMMSYIVPRYLLLQEGLTEQDYTPVFASNPLNAVLAVYFKQVDAGGAGDIVMNLPKIKKIAHNDTLTYLKQSVPIKHLPWAVRRDMALPLKLKIQLLMANLKDSDKGKAILDAARVTNFRIARDSDYNSARTIIKEVMTNNNQQ